MTHLRIGVLVSGRGSNLEAILRAVERGAIKGASVEVVVSNDPGARALKVAAKRGVSTVAFDGAGMSRERLDEEVEAALRAHGVLPGEGLVLLAGYTRILSKRLAELYEGRMMNIHPSLLPSFPGMRAQRQALDKGVKVSGCTVHFVAPEVDAGPIIAQRPVPVRESDDEDSLSSRILRQEHKVYPYAVRLFAEGRLQLKKGRVVVKD